MGERIINPILNVQEGKRYKNMIFINPYRFGFVDATSNVFLGTVNSLWSNPANWSRGYIPLSTETARIRAACILDTTTTVDKLIVDAGYNLDWQSGSNRVLTVNNDYTNQGAVNISAGIANSLVLNGANLSSAGVFTAGANSTVIYGRSTDQNILNLPYSLLTFNAGSKRFLPNGTFTVGSIFQTGQSPNPNIIEKLNTGDLVCIGQLNLGNFTQLNLGSNNLEIRAGFRAQSTNAIIICAAIRVTTNNQSAILQNGMGITLTGNIFIGNSITFTNNFGLVQAGLDVSGTINGGNAGSTFINNGKLVIRTFNALMTVGVFTNNSGSLIVIAYTGNSVLPNLTYYNLTYSASGIKALGQNTTILTDLITSSTGQINLSNFNLTVNGVASINGASSNGNTISGGAANSSNTISSIISTGTGGLIFIGELRGFNFGVINIGSNIVECRGGIRSAASTSFVILSPILFSTNNQNLVSTNGGAGFQIIIENSLTIGNGLTITNAINTISIITGVLNGSNGSSILDNRGTLEYQTSTAPMLTGQLQTNNAANTFRYNRAGNQDVLGGTYRTIEFGSSGVKKLLGNVIINTTAGGSQSTTGTASIDLNGFTITTI